MNKEYTRNEIQSDIFHELSQLVENKIQDSESSLSDGGIDSIQTIKLIIALEKRFDVSIPDQYFSHDNFQNVSTITDVLASLLSTGE